MRKEIAKVRRGINKGCFICSFYKCISIVFQRNLWILRICLETKHLRLRGKAKLWVFQKFKSFQNVLTWV